MNFIKKYSYVLSITLGIILFLLITQGTRLMPVITFLGFSVTAWVLFKEVSWLVKSLILLVLTTVIASVSFTLFSTAGLNGVQAFLMVFTAVSLCVTISYFIENFNSRWDSSIFSLLTATCLTAFASSYIPPTTITYFFGGLYLLSFYVKHYVLSHRLSKEAKEKLSLLTDENFETIARKLDELGYKTSIIKKGIPILIADNLKGRKYAILSYEGDFDNSPLSKKDSLKALFQKTFRKISDRNLHYVVVSNMKPAPKNRELKHYSLKVKDTKTPVEIISTTENYSFLQ